MSSKLYLYGKIGEKFGKEHNFAVESLSDCIVMLSTQFDKVEIKNEFCKHDFELIRNDKKFNANDVKMKFDTDSEFHLIPAVAGSGKGVFNMIVGAALIGAAFFIPEAGVFGLGILTGASVGLMGAGLFLSGLTYKAIEVDNYSDRNDSTQKSSYLFSNGPVNVTEQGAVVPIGFGEFYCGSVVIGSELQTEDI